MADCSKLLSSMRHSAFDADLSRHITLLVELVRSKRPVDTYDPRAKTEEDGLQFPPDRAASALFSSSGDAIRQ